MITKYTYFDSLFTFTSSSGPPSISSIGLCSISSTGIWEYSDPPALLDHSEVVHKRVGLVCSAKIS